MGEARLTAGRLDPWEKQFFPGTLFIGWPTAPKDGEYSQRRNAATDFQLPIQHRLPLKQLAFCLVLHAVEYMMITVTKWARFTHVKWEHSLPLAQAVFTHPQEHHQLVSPSAWTELLRP